MSKSNVIDAFIKDTSTNLEGTIAVSVVEVDSGLTLGSYSNGNLDPEVASAYNVDVVKSKHKAIEALKLKEGIDDILITLDSQYHIINVSDNGKHMIYFAGDKGKTNLAIARNVIKNGAQSISKNL